MLCSVHFVIKGILYTTVSKRRHDHNRSTKNKQITNKEYEYNTSGNIDKPICVGLDPVN